jgi:hypothetical protein
MKELLPITPNNFSIYCWGQSYDVYGSYYDRVLIYCKKGMPDSFTLRAATTPTAECPGGNCAERGLIPLDKVDCLLLSDDWLRRQSTRPLRELLSEPNYAVPLSTYDAVYRHFRPFPWVSVEVFRIGSCDECGRFGWHAYSQAWVDND